MEARIGKLTDREFEKAIATLQEGRVPFDSPKMLRRFADTIVDKLWEKYESPVESG
ncbi:MAG TPA: hypothetical protein VMU99_09420 [Acidimicrobiales bacterium]|nr:hypothetical protein [Acidimicrobiales bacterium]